jgi:hypothetical protein
VDRGFVDVEATDASPRALRVATGARSFGDTNWGSTGETKLKGEGKPNFQRSAAGGEDSSGLGATVPYRE